ncbi:glycosyltransferase family 4 protein [Patescibacteria group bacterium]|nr:glycosyltransferase family 4 protein [Patescibacteria group bacterium]
MFTGYYLPHIGGLESYIGNLSKKLKQLGAEIIIVTSNHSSLPDTETIDGVKVYRLPVTKFLRDRFPIPKFCKKYFAIRKKVIDEKSDIYILHTRFFLTTLIGARIAKKSRKPAIVIEHGSGYLTQGNRVVDFCFRQYEHLVSLFVKKRAAAFYGVSKKCNEWLRNFGIVADGVFYNGVNQEDVGNKDIDIRKKYNIPRNKVIISFAGRLIREKGITSLLESFAELIKEEENVFLLVMGDGPLLPEISDKYGKDKNIRLLGGVNHSRVMNILAASDIVVQPSVYPEGLSTILLESGLNECAVISTPMGGAKEVIIDSNYGIIINPNSQEELVKAMKYLIENKTYRNKIAQNLHERVLTHFNWDQTAKQVLKEVNDITKQYDN